MVKKKSSKVYDLMIEKGMASSEEDAMRLIMASLVLVDDTPVKSGSLLVDRDANIRLRSAEHPYVGRGALKLKGALKNFLVDVEGKVCVDVGSSTGGFTEILLQNGAKKVYCVDVGYGILDWSLRNDKRVVLFERTNIRDLERSALSDSIDIVVVDLSFISLSSVLPKLDSLISKDARIVALVKPQFELDSSQVEEGGIVTSNEVRLNAVEGVKIAGLKLGWEFKGMKESPIKGTKGNVEYFIYFIK